MTKHEQRVTKPYRIGWTTVKWWRIHRPWQSESGTDRFARRAFTPEAAERKMLRDVSYHELFGKPSPWQRYKRMTPRARRVHRRLEDR